MASTEKPEAGSPSPSAGDSFTYNGKEYSVVREGLASILIPPTKTKEEPQQVFYNPIQQFNRDLSVLAIKAFGEERAAAVQGKSGKKRKRESVGNGEKGGKAAKTDNDSSPQSAEQAAAPESAPQQDVSQAETQDVQNTEKKQNVPRKPISILDALSASGLRALRYAHELPFPTSVTANDLTATAVESIKLNVLHNNLQDKITVSQDDALAHMYRRIADSLSRRDRMGNPSQSLKYDVIDLDPYGTAAPFLDAAVQAIKDGGMLCVTCTDSAVWAGHSYPEKTYALYGGIPLKNFCAHEAGLRLVLHSIASSAARYGLVIEPLLSLSADFYVRVFVKVSKSQAALKFLAAKTMFVYNCDHGCGSYETQHLMRARAVRGKKGGAHYKHMMAQAPACDMFCSHCGTKMHLGGPMYGGYIHSPSFVQRILDGLPELDDKVYGTVPRIRGMLQTALEEYIPVKVEDEGVEERDREAARVDPAPLFFSTSKLASAFQATAPGEDAFRGALRHLGYAVTRSHCRPGSLKTDAPWKDIVFIMREWVRQRAPVKVENIKKGSPAWRILGLGEDGGAKYGRREEKASGEGESVKEDDNMAEEEEKRAESGKAQTDEEKTKEELRRTLVFNEDLEKLGREKRDRKLVRYQANPRENWGPMSRAKGS
ncbi:hypothetical protein VUR80DRAFT_3156 [Thermomyces stellatus]